MEKIYKNIDNYYTDKINQYGSTPKGVDWNSEESQFVRFKQLSKVINNEKFSIADIGCGYGKYVDFLEKHYTNFKYVGYDLSVAMIESANKMHPDKEHVSFKCVKSISAMETVDYSIASGIFSVRMQHNESEWLVYILKTLNVMSQMSTKGFSFNMLTKYSDKEYMRDDLYYADPLFFFDYCKKSFSKNISLNHDYDLYEFTIIVRKD